MQAECENPVEHLKVAGTQGPKVCSAQVGLVAALRRRLATSGDKAGGEPPYVGESWLVSIRRGGAALIL